jgi:tetratricopeptide (TPR) repeat protein
MEPLERAVAELQEQNFGSAIRALEMITARDPSSADAYKHLSQAYHRTGQREKAAEAAQRYASLKPTDPAGHYNAGVLLAQLRQTEAAVRSFRAALSADPGYVKAHQALAKLGPAADATVPLTPPVAGPQFAAPPQPAAPAPAAPPGEQKRRGPMPLAAKVAAAGTVIASVAILLWLFLPGGPANPGPSKTNPRPSPSGIATPPPTEPSAEQPNPMGAPQPQTPEVQPQANAPATIAPQPQTNPNQPAPTNPLPAANSGPSTQAKPLMSPQEAQRVVNDMNTAHQQEVAAARAEIGRIAEAIRGLDEETWKEGGRDSIVLMTTQMLGTEVSAGSLQALKLVADAPTPRQAADNLENYARQLPPALPAALVAEMSRVLSTPGIGATQAYGYIKTMFARQGIDLLDEPEKRLKQALSLTPMTTGTAIPGH